MAKRGTLEHPKVLTLADELGIMDCFALGIMEAFWQHVAKYHEDGDVTTLKPGAMARSIRYSGDPQALWDALITARFLDVLEDGRTLVHDWADHAEDSVHTKLYRAVKPFADGSIPKPRSIGTRERESLDSLWTSSGHIADVLPKPKPKPKPKPDNNNNNSAGAQESPVGEGNPEWKGPAEYQVQGFFDRLKPEAYPNVVPNVTWRQFWDYWTLKGNWPVQWQTHAQTWARNEKPKARDAPGRAVVAARGRPQSAAEVFADLLAEPDEE